MPFATIGVGGQPLRNMVLQEAVENTSPVKTEPIVTSIKKLMNTCKLTKFKSSSACAQFYSAFFLCTLEDDVRPTVEQWGTIYSTLLGSDTFCADLALYMSMYQPAVYTGIFMPLWNQIQSELASMKQNQVRYLSLTKGMITMIQSRMNGVGEIVRSQVHDVNIIKFVTVVDQVLNKFIYDLTVITQDEIVKSVKPDDTAPVPIVPNKLDEDVQEILDLIENGAEWIAQRSKFYEEQDGIGVLDEGIVSNATEKLKAMQVAAKKGERDFDEFVMKKVKKMREERRNRKHSEMVGESLRISTELKRILKSLPYFAVPQIGAALAVIRYLGSIIIDRQTDKKDRAVLVGQIRDELEIVEEKIAMAERNGDDKARIELIRFRQKLQREYERIQHVRYDANARARINNIR